MPTTSPAGSYRHPRAIESTPLPHHSGTRVSSACARKAASDFPRVTVALTQSAEHPRFVRTVLTARQEHYFRSDFRDKIRWNIPVEDYLRGVLNEDHLDVVPGQVYCPGRIVDVFLSSRFLGAREPWTDGKTNKIMHIARLADSFLTQAYGSESSHHAAGGFSNCVGSDHLTPLENARASQPCTEAGDASPSVGKGSPSLLETGDQHSQAGVDSKRRREPDEVNDSDLDALRPKRFCLAPAQSSPADVSEPQTNDPPHVMTRGELRAILYMYRVLTSSVWTFVLGWLVKDDQVRLIYGDRMGLVFTRTFSAPRDARGCTLPVVSVMGFVGVGNPGLDKSFDGATPRDGHSQGGYAGAKFRLDAPGEHGAITELEFDVDQDEPMHIPSGLLGRGTLVVPITAPPGSEATQLCGSEPLVAKIAWPQVALHQAEDQTIMVVRRKLAEKNKKYCDHIVDLKCLVTRSIEAMSLPRCAMGVIPKDEDLRVCRTMVLKRYECLEDIGSADAFHSVFVDVVRAHCWVYKTSGILHGDISINNVMWCLRDGRVIGVLCDFDLAKIQKEDSSASPGVRLANHPEKSETRYGTGLFMAMDLLREGLPPLHKYRHDLESFFYIYVYVAAAYDPTNKVFGYIKQWQHSSLVAVGDSKHKFLAKFSEFENIVETAHEAFKPLVTLDGVLCRLWDLFHDLERAMDRIDDVRARARGGRLQDHQKAEIEEIQRARDELVTYSIFMKVMGEAEE